MDLLVPRSARRPEAPSSWIYSHLAGHCDVSNAFLDATAQVDLVGFCVALGKYVSQVHVVVVDEIPSMCGACTSSRSGFSECLWPVLRVGRGGMLKMFHSIPEFQGQFYAAPWAAGMGSVLVWLFSGPPAVSDALECLRRTQSRMMSDVWTCICSGLVSSWLFRGLIHPPGRQLWPCF